MFIGFSNTIWGSYSELWKAEIKNGSKWYIYCCYSTKWKFSYSFKISSLEKLRVPFEEDVSPWSFLNILILGWQPNFFQQALCAWSQNFTRATIITQTWSTQCYWQSGLKPILSPIVYVAGFLNKEKIIKGNAISFNGWCGLSPGNK